MARDTVGEAADVEAVRRVLRVLRHGGPSELLDRYDELLTADFEWHPALLAAFRKRTYRGREEFAEYWREFSEGFEGPSLGDTEFEALGSGRVLGAGRLSVHELACRRWRGALDHVVLAVEEVGGIFGIRRHRFESRKGSEDGRGPFPPVADQIVHAPGTGAARAGADRDRIPGREVEVPARGIGSRVAPRKAAFGVVARRRAERGAMILGLGRNPPPSPTRERSRFLVAHIHGPRRGKRDVLEHCPPVPPAAVANPESGMRDVVVLHASASRPPTRARASDTHPRR